MLNDPYSPCPCGSGKKFKWCCQPIHAEISQVLQLDEEGQHEAAMRAMDEVVAKHSTNPEVYGRKAQLLFQNDQVEESEKTLEKAFELFPDYPFGYFLKARFRLYEGEIAGAAMLLRKAAELYDPNATDILAQIQIDIFDCEMKLNHPIAAHAAAELALKFNPANDSIRQGIATVFGKENPNLPAPATREYRYKALPEGASGERHTVWDTALKSAGTGRLTDAIKAFETLTQGEGAEPAAWFNLGLSHAWAGNNAAGLQALDEYVAKETEETQAAEAWAMAEVLRFGQGMEDQADLVMHAATLGLRDPRAFVEILGELEKEGRLTGAQINQEQGILRAIILEAPGPALTPELAARQGLRAACDVTLMGNFVNLSSTSKESLDKILTPIQQKLGNMMVEPQMHRGPARFSDVLNEGIQFPRNAATKEEAEERIRDSIQKFFEEVWIHRPLKSLNGVPPVDAVGHGVLKKKLRGLLQFTRECIEMTGYPYDFDRVLRKLGLLEGAPAPSQEGGAVDIASLGAAELAGLATDSLSTPDLDLAYQTAMKLDARELAGKFASLLVARPSYAERRDRFPLYQLLIQQSLSQGNLDSALDLVNEGESDDCTNNEGRRRNEFELRRAQVHAKRGEYDQAADVYDRLISRVPTEWNYRINAAETMLSAKQKDKAMKFAKEGHAAAVKANNRDLEGHFRELMDAAK